MNVDERTFGESQSAAFDAIKAWYEAGSSAACVVYGPPGAGKSSMVERFWRSLEEPDLQKVLVRAGRVFGVPFEHDVLAALAAGLWPDAAPLADDPRALRARLANAIANWNAADGDPPLLLGLTQVDACSDWPDDPGASVLGDLGPSVRVVLTIAGPRAAAEAWARRLGLHPEHITWVPMNGFPVEAIDVPLRARLSWAAIDGPGPIPFTRALNRALRDVSDDGMIRLLSLLTQALAPLRVGDAALLLGAREADIRRLTDLNAFRREIDAMLQWSDARDIVRLRHEALRSAWEHTDAEGVGWCAQRFADAASELIQRWVEGRAPEGDRGGYLRRHAGDHLLSVCAPPSVLLALCEPGWAWPCSRGDLAARRAELRRIRRSITRPLLGSSATTIPKDAAAQITRVALAQGALGSLNKAWNERDEQPREGVWDRVEPSLAVALIALAALASQPLRGDISARAIELAKRTGAEWGDAQALLEVARVASGGEAAIFARWALAAAQRNAEGPHLPLWLAAARCLPPGEAEAIADEAIQRALMSAQPGRALASLAGAKGLEINQALALMRAAMALPLPSRATALSPLLGVLPEEHRGRAASAIVEAFFEDVSGEGERIDGEACAAALAPFLSEPAISALLADPILGTGEALAVRLAELGHPTRALDIEAQLCGGGIHGARLLLRAAAATETSALVEVARTAVSSLKPEWLAATLVREHAAAAVNVLGLDACVGIAERAGGDGSHFARIATLAALCRAAPEAVRPSLASCALAAYRAAPETDSLEALIGCAPWMSPPDAMWLFTTSLGDAADTVTLVATLRGWGGVEQLAPLVSRVGGDEAIATVADAVREAGRWVSRSNSGIASP